MKNGHLENCPGGYCSCEERRYWRVLGIALIITALEVVGGFLSGSLALLSDAGHVFIDGVSCVVAIIVAKKVKDHRSSENRIRAVGGFIHAGLLLAVVAIIFNECWHRFGSAQEIVGGYMLSVAVLGALGNWYQHVILESVGHQHITSQGLAVHVLSDFWQSLAVILTSMIIWLTDLVIFDPIISFLIALAMLKWSGQLAWKSYRLFKAD